MAIVEETRPKATSPVAEEVRAWLASNWDPELTVGEWWERLADSGWAVPTWPEEWFGRGLSGDSAAVVSAALREAGALGPPAGLGLMLAGPTIVAHGTDEQKQRYLRPIVTGQEAWCQLFSEPGAGSDLASLQCRAVQDGEEWVVNGQKVWTSGAQVADLGMLVARTDVDVPKHRGISYFAIEMDQPGVDVRPLREMTGRALFNEVFLDDARVPDDALIGGRNSGWMVALTTLANERAGLGGGGGGGMGMGMPGRRAGMLERRVGDLARGGGGGAQRALGSRGYATMKRAADAEGRTGEAVVRQSLATLYSLEQISRFTMLRTKASKAAGRGPGPEANTAKLAMSRITRLCRDLGLDLIGAKGMLAGGDAPMGGALQEMAMFAPAVSIYGGSDEVQRNIIGERVLGLPKEPSDDRTTPFKDLQVGTARRG
ncbi:MAG: acyl-CoA dehydrogenase family protein [Acidimicrobiia bacterium]|nr:acyl-CoA dehydrogenase family protein [Acidimicrobiia bacterium]